MKKYLPFIKLFSAVIVLVVAVNYVELLASRPSGSYPNGQIYVWNTGDSINSRTGSVLLGHQTFLTPTSGSKLDIFGSLYTKGLTSEGNTAITGNLSTKSLSISGIPSTTTPQKVCISSTGQLNICPTNTNVRIFDTSGSWTVPTGVNSITLEVWGAGGAGYTNISSNSQTLPTNTVFQGTNISVTANAGTNASSGGNGVGGSASVSGGRSTYLTPEIHVGENGSVPAYNQLDQLVEDYNCPSSTYSFRYGSDGGDGAVGGAAYLGIQTITSGRKAAKLSDAQQYCSLIPSAPRFYGNSNPANIQNGVFQSANGAIPGGGGSTPGGGTGHYGFYGSGSSGTFQGPSQICPYYIGTNPGRDYCVGEESTQIRVGLPGSTEINTARGGGAGGYIKIILPVTPNEQFTYTIGQGGTRGTTVSGVTNGSGGHGRVKITY